MLGAGVNSEAGVVGNVVLDEPNDSTRNGMASGSNHPTFSIVDGGGMASGYGYQRAANGTVINGVNVRQWNALTKTRSGLSIGRETSSLQMAANPRIVIQEEEEAKLGVVDGTPSTRVHPVADLVMANGQAIFSADLDIPFNQSQSYGYAVPQSGGNAFSGSNVIQAPNLTAMVVQSPKVTLFVADNSGTFRNVKLNEGGNWDNQRAEAMAAEFNQSGAILLSAMLPQETGYWNPTIVTDEQGNATVTFSLPDRSTAWKLLAKGLTTETLAGEATDDLTVKKDLFGEVKLPMAFTDGDEVEIPVSIHNDVVEKGPIEVVLKTTIAGRMVEEKKTIDATAKGIHELRFKATMNRPSKNADGAGESNPEIDVQFELIVKAGQRLDVVHRAVPLKPYGIPVFATAGGSAESDTTSWVEPPKGMPLESPGLQILIGPSIERKPVGYRPGARAVVSA